MHTMVNRLREDVVEMQSEAIARCFNDGALVQGEVIDAVFIPQEMSLCQLQSQLDSDEKKVLGVLTASTKSVIVSILCVKRIEKILEYSEQLGHETQSELMRLKSVICNEQVRWLALESENLENLQSLFQESGRKNQICMGFYRFLRDIHDLWGLPQDALSALNQDSNFFIFVRGVLKETAGILREEVEPVQMRANLGIKYRQWVCQFQETKLLLAEIMGCFGMYYECDVPAIKQPIIAQTWESVARVFNFFKELEVHKQYDLEVFSAYVERLLENIKTQEMEQCCDERVIQDILDSCLESAFVRSALYQVGSPDECNKAIQLAKYLYDSCTGKKVFDMIVPASPVIQVVCALAGLDVQGFCEHYLWSNWEAHSRLSYEPICISTSVSPIFRHVVQLARCADRFQKLQDPEAIACYNQEVPLMQRVLIGVRHLSCEPVVAVRNIATYAGFCMFLQHKLLPAVTSNCLGVCLQELDADLDMRRKVNKPYAELRESSYFYVQNKGWLEHSLRTGEGVSSLIKSFLKGVDEENLIGFFNVMYHTPLGYIFKALAQRNKRTLQESGCGVQFGDEQVKQVALDVFST